jgi:hypothetical protein
MNAYTKGLCVLVCAGPVLGAQAADQTTALHSGWQFGAGIGQSTVQVPGGSFIQYGNGGPITEIPGSDDLHAFGYKLFAGYRFGRYFAIEGAYEDGGSLGWSYVLPTNPPVKPPPTLSFNADPHIGALTAMGVLPVAAGFSLFARAGAAYWWYDAELDLPAGGRATYDENSHTLIWGAGASLFVDGALMRVEYEQMRPHLTAFGAGSPDGRWRLVSLAVVWML